MVNKAALSVLGVIVFVSMGVGVLIGMYIAGPADGTGATAGNGSGDVTESQPTETVPTPVPTAGPTTGDESTPPLHQRTTVAPRRYEPAPIERAIQRKINDRREERGLRTLLDDGRTVTKLSRMARQHSVEMADAGYVSHTIDGNTSYGRYHRFDLYSTCGFTSDPGTYSVTPSRNRLEMVGRTVAGKPYDDDGESRFNENADEVAQAIVDDWFASVNRHRLTYENAERIGVGIEVTRDGTVYATANIC